MAPAASSPPPIHGAGDSEPLARVADGFADGSLKAVDGALADV